MKQKVKTVFLACIILLITYLLIVFPEQSFHASVQGLHVWWEVVFPSLLPFFIIAELLISFGIVQFIGVLFQPIMRPLFNVPGVGSFAWFVGMASGYPAGAKMGARLREENSISKIEAERLVSFSNASSPLFIFGAIAIGFFQQPVIGMLIAISHYVSNLFVGICMRFYGKKSRVTATRVNNENRFMKGMREMHRMRLKETRPFGQIVGDAVITSVQTLLMIGGFIILFSVLTTLFNVIHITYFLRFIISPFTHFLGFNDAFIDPAITGLFEITMGAEKIAHLPDVSLLFQLMIVSFLLGFNGLSVHAQVASILAKTDIRYGPYFFARILHGVFAIILTYLLYPFFFKKDVTPVAQFATAETENYFRFFVLIGPLITLSALLLAIILYIHRLKKTMYD